MSEKFLLVNPILIGGKSNFLFEANSSNEAAQQAWNSISENIVNLLPKSYFTLKNEKNKLFHYMVKEQISSYQQGGGNLKYSISQYDLDLPKNIHRLFLEKVDNIINQRNTIHSLQKNNSDNQNDNDDNDHNEHSSSDSVLQEGGTNNDHHKKHHKKKHHSDDDSSDSDSDEGDKYLVKLYKKWKRDKFLSYVEPSVFYWWYTPTIYKLSSIYTPIPNSILYYNDITPYYKQVILT